MLNDLIAWQWELAIAASRFRLGLLSDDEIVAFTHKLMNEGYYDDLMLEIIDDDPLFYFDEKSEFIKRNFTQLWQKLNFPIVSNYQAKYLFTFTIFYPFSNRPFNLCAYKTHEINYPLIAEYEETLVNYHEIRESYFLREMPLNEIDWQNKPKHYVDYSQMVTANTAFSLACEKWLNHNQLKILEIMHQLFPQH